ncbi:hypothetical protein SMKI_05G0840 [Saccharomyces mikatae IFO 1815]|uniref:Exocyst complex component Sec3 PIP2-binding N-terminal domain-containing protein n=1 Tax=Saccharomyces mikatae IFO 1815 TaxID=226126 RepID=A0AA35IWZ7_SACMI|nr:uncharacterized protein SMKI_05G0840 [Saccharomyces mikatae IFO 1815]CAI4038474.1 hypothetical protein SMKI_05G0840 [Saccharomyces mikatae IFO 1815]
MRSSKSPFKRKSHSRETSHDENTSFFHKRTISGSSAHHSRNVSQGAIPSSAPPISGGNYSHKRNVSRASNSSQSSNFLAEQYERDRKAIINCCFSRPDHKTGEPPSNYITHVRIIEDSKFPSSKPPPDSRLENKKKRLLILSAKPNNPKLIQIHKARENSDGSFQIGRTWQLNELVRVEKDLDISEGFILTMGKKYYWETNSAKERTVFIKSLITLYIQTFEGHVPELVNWDLSLFYLDERSYHRAVITNRAGPISPIKSPTSNFAVNSAKSMGSVPSSTSFDRTRRSETEGNIPVATPTGTTYHPGTKSLNKPPYSSNSTLNEVNRRYEQEQQQQQQEAEQRRSEDQRKMQLQKENEIKRLEEEKRIKQEERKKQIELELELQRQIEEEEQKRKMELERQQQFEEEQRLNKERELLDLERRQREQEILERQRKEEQEALAEKEEKEKSTRNKSEDENYAQEINGKVDNLLEDLNAVLGEDTETTPIMQNSAHIPERSTARARDQLKKPLNIAKVEALNGSDLNDSISLDDEIAGLSTSNISEEYQDEKNDLSFEKGDEIRYSKNFEGEVSHVYHEVSIIQEETPTVSKKIILPEENKSDVLVDLKEETRKMESIDDEVLLEILTDINWTIEDDADSMIERIDMRLAEAEYSFNQNLLSLQQIGPNLEPYENKVSEECHRIIPTFSLFLMEMSNFSNDIENVESQDNGLQVESANKKLLWSTLDELLKTVSLDEVSLNQLLECPIREKNLPWMENQLNLLLKAFQAIGSDENEVEYNLREISGLKQRLQFYEKVTKIFIDRIVEEMEKKFSNIHGQDISHDQMIRILTTLLIFSPLILFCKEISQKSYQTIVENWNINIQPIYMELWTKKISQLESIDVNHDRMSKLSLNQLLQQWNTFRKERKINDANPVFKEKFSLLTECIQVIRQECIVYQNFVEVFFHISSKHNFETYIKHFNDPDTPPILLDAVRVMQSDREAAVIETQLVSRIFQPIVTRLSSYFVELVKTEPTVAPALTLYLENEIKSLESSNHEFLLSAVTRVYTQIKQVWSDNIDEQVLYFERTSNATTNGEIIPAIVDLPVDLKNSEDLFKFTKSAMDIKDIDDNYESIELMSSSFRKLSVAATQSIAHKEGNSNINPSLSDTTALNNDYMETISLLVNSNWLTEMLSMLNFNKDGIFDTSLQNVKKVFDVERESYASFLLRDTMPKLTAFVYGVSNIIENTNNVNMTNPSRWAAYSRQNLENILLAYTSHEIETLVARLHSHMVNDFGCHQEDAINNALCDKLWSCIQGQTVSLYLKLYTVVDKHYRGTNIRFTKNDIISAFEEYKSS